MGSFYERLNGAKLAVLDTVDYYNQGQIITRINVPASHRGQGIARRLLRRATDLADVLGTTLWLEVSPSDGLGFAELEAWYHRHGFVRSGTGLLRRKPQKGAPQ